MPNILMEVDSNEFSLSTQHPVKSGSFLRLCAIVSSINMVLPESGLPATKVYLLLGIPPPVASFTLNDGVGIYSITNFSAMSSSLRVPITVIPAALFMSLIASPISFFLSANVFLLTAI